MLIKAISLMLREVDLLKFSKHFKFSIDNFYI
jgi:hypothetical protein